MKPLSPTADSAVVFHSSRIRFFWLPSTVFIGLLCLQLFFLNTTPPAPYMSFMLIPFFCLAGTCIALLGVAHFRLVVQLNDSDVRVALPNTESGIWFPWKYCQSTIPWHEIKQIDIVQRKHPFASQGFLRSTTIHTTQGDFYLNSLWFKQFDEFLVALQSRSGIRTNEVLLAEPQFNLHLPEGIVRGVGKAVCLLLLLATLVVAIPAMSNAASYGAFTYLFLVLAYVAAEKLACYRQPISKAAQ